MPTVYNTCEKDKTAYIEVESFSQNLLNQNNYDKYL